MRRPRIKTAAASAVTYLNAGRGNPNWIATEPREAFFLLGQFAITESKRVLDLPPGVGGMPQAAGIADRACGVAGRSMRTLPGARFLAAMVPWAVEQVRFRSPTRSCTSWSIRSSATTTRCPIACSCTTSRSCTNICNGRCAATAAAEGQVQHLCASKAARRRCATSSSR